jgi:3-dehydroquinate dehydratase-1
VIDALRFATHHLAMERVQFLLEDRQVRVVGSIGSPLDLQNSTPPQVRDCCDIAEIRLDLLLAAGQSIDCSHWQHLAEVPLLFTARRIEEGGALALSPAARMDLLRKTLDQAAWVDIEVASIQEMGELLQELAARQIPWIASYHDFAQVPSTAALEHAARLAKDAGAAVFKAAEFQVADHGLPVATMGMGPLAPVSRLLCAQSGSVLNYGYLGSTATAPGQWDCALLKLAISRLAPYRP